MANYIIISLSTMRFLCCLLFLVCVGGLSVYAQYFPPLTGTAWETTSPASLGWCDDRVTELSSYLASTQTKAFIILKDGRIAVEWYYGTFTRDSLWYWASAGKTVTAFLVGKAQEEGSLSISQPTSTYLGAGWTSAPAAKEALITVRHQLTMSSGLDDRVANRDCTTPACLRYLADAGTRWAYHNGPYTLLDQVVERATGQGFNAYYTAKLRNTIGMNGLFIQTGDNNVLYTNARSMARFGWLIANSGRWNGTAIMRDAAYLTDMLNTSQNLNRSYGYLWWLNGKSSFMVPTLQTVFQGSIHPDAPADMFSAMGKNGQLLNILPSAGLIVLRMGNNADASLVPFAYNNEIIKRVVRLNCNVTGLWDGHNQQTISLFPNPANDQVAVQVPEGETFVIDVFDSMGRNVARTDQSVFSVRGWTAGLYHLRLSRAGGIAVASLIVP